MVKFHERALNWSLEAPPSRLIGKPMWPSDYREQDVYFKLCFERSYNIRRDWSLERLEAWSHLEQIESATDGPASWGVTRTISINPSGNGAYHNHQAEVKEAQRVQLDNFTSHGAITN